MHFFCFEQLKNVLQLYIYHKFVCPRVSIQLQMGLSLTVDSHI